MSFEAVTGTNGRVNPSVTEVNPSYKPIEGAGAPVPQHVPGGSSAPSSKYHSAVYNLLTWQDPVASGSCLGLLLAVLFVGRFVNVLRFVFFGSWVIFATAAALEYAGRALSGKGERGFAQNLRPRQYYTIGSDIVNPLFDEIHSLLNFFLVEFQRVIFAENLRVTIAAFAFSWVAYKLIAYVPAWGLFLTGLLLAFTAPPVYLQYREPIDAQISRAQSIADEKLGVARGMVEQHTGTAASTVRQYANLAAERVGMSGASRQTISPETSTGPSTGASSLGTGQSTGVAASTSTGAAVPTSLPESATSTSKEPGVSVVG